MENEIEDENFWGDTIDGGGLEELDGTGRREGRIKLRTRTSGRHNKRIRVEIETEDGELGRTD